MIGTKAIGHTRMIEIPVKENLETIEMVETTDIKETERKNQTHSPNTRNQGIEDSNRATSDSNKMANHLLKHQKSNSMIID